MSKPKRSQNVRALAAVLLILVASVSGVYVFQRLNSAQTNGSASTTQSHTGPSCDAPLGGSTILRTQLAPPATFGGVTEFTLPTPLRDPNSPTVAPDGSVWFAEQSVAGLGHFFPDNRTLVEYAWPYAYSAPPSEGGICGDKTDVWGVALWNGKVWASDPTGNQLVATDPSTGQVTSVKLHTNDSFPYTLTPGPNDTLWFSELFASKIGELSSNGTVHEFPLPGGINSTPSQIIFVNSTTGYYSDVGRGTAGGGVYSFNPDHFAPALVGGQKLTDPSSLAVGSGVLWVALHGSSSVAGYNFTTKSWSYYPTTPVSWNSTTLPYFVEANGSSVWFNEHYGNRMARIDTVSNSLTEFSESNGLVNASLIGNTLTFALGGSRAWFPQWTGNVLGYVDALYAPGFSTSIAGNSTIVVQRGASASVDLVVHDTTYKGELSLSFADSETLISRPSNLSYSAATSSLSPSVGADASLRVTITASQSLRPGTYTAILTVTDGLTYESSFLKIVVPG